MAEFKLVARVHNEGDDTFIVRSPGVGVIDALPEQGHYLNPMEGFFTLTVLGRRHLVLLPRGVQGRVSELHVDGTYCPVEYDQPLVTLKLGAESEAEQAASRGGGTGDAADADLINVPAPSEGIFYRRPSPDSPCYVEPGSTVKTGGVLGLVEVMKSFNQIVYGGPGLPERGTVVEVCVEDSAEVAFGQTLVKIRPEG